VSTTAYICVTCGVQQPPSPSIPARCPICEDERQYVRQGGQAWTTLAELAKQGHRVELRELEPGLIGIGAQPAVGIGQRAFAAEVIQLTVLVLVRGLRRGGMATAASPFRLAPG